MNQFFFSNFIKKFDFNILTCMNIIGTLTDGGQRGHIRQYSYPFLKDLDLFYVVLDVFRRKTSTFSTLKFNLYSSLERIHKKDKMYRKLRVLQSKQ